jgi:Kef-type K+ transport system membrane component KefB
MDDNLEPKTSGWTFGKVIGLLLGLIGMIGFGLCTLCGLVFSGSGDAEILGLTFLGACMTALSTWLVVAMIRKARESRDRNNP